MKKHKKELINALRATRCWVPPIDVRKYYESGCKKHDGTTYRWEDRVFLHTMWFCTYFPRAVKACICILLGRIKEGSPFDHSTEKWGEPPNYGEEEAVAVWDYQHYSNWTGEGASWNELILGRGLRPRGWWVYNGYGEW